MKRTRMAPPPHLRHVNTKLVAGTFDKDRLLAQGWTIVESEGTMTTDAPQPESVVKDRIEQVLGEAPRDRRKRPRIVRPAQAILFALALSGQAIAQEPITRLNFDSTEVYTFNRVSASFKHPDGGDVDLIVVRASKTGLFYRIAMRHEYTQAMKPGEIVILSPGPLQ